MVDKYWRDKQITCDHCHKSDGTLILIESTGKYVHMFRAMCKMPAIPEGKRLMNRSERRHAR